MKNKKMQLVIIAFFVGISGLVYGYNNLNKTEKLAVTYEEDHEPTVDTHSIEEDSSKIVVYICGCVNKPGIYNCNLDDRIADVIKMAGGVTSTANINQINLASKLTDGQKIYIPSIQEESESVYEEDEKDSLVDINNASCEELMTLPGVGKARAESIIEYRDNYGSFKKIEDIMNVSGIKEAMFGKFKDKIKV